MKVVLLGRMAAAARGGVQSQLGDAVQVVAIPQAVCPAERLVEFDNTDVIVGGPLTAAIIERAPQLKLFHVFRGGIDGLGVELLPDHVRVCNTFHHETGVAEFAVMAMLMLPRQVCHYDRQLRQGNWRGSVMWGEPPQQETLDGKNVLIVGAGHIGREIAVRTRAFGARVTGVTRNPSQPIDGVDYLVEFSKWRDELPQADFVVASVRLAAETEGMFGVAEFAAMKRSAYFINVARAAVAQERALYEALQENQIAGAAIDVWYRHPQRMEEACLPSREPFHELNNVLMSPTRSSWTKDMLAARASDVAENVRRLEHGRELINRVKT